MIPSNKYPENANETMLRTCLKMQLFINESLFAHIKSLNDLYKKLEDNQNQLWEATFDGDESPTGLGLGDNKRWEL